MASPGTDVNVCVYTRSDEELSHQKLFTQYRSHLPGKALPSALPLVLQSDYEWSPQDGCVRRPEGQEDNSSQLKVNNEAIEFLKTIKKPIAVLAVCGPYRSGKSYFISRLLGKPGIFKLGHSMEVCTRGIWLSTSALECDEFVLVLLDTEGIGAVEGEGPESTTTKLLVLTTLLSSLLVYNSNEVPQCSDLEQMNIFTHLSQSISITKEAKECSTLQGLQEHFPHFVWLLRNVVNLPEDDDGNSIPLETYLHSEVLCTTQESRNVSQTLQAIFPSLKCQYLPPPSADPDITCDLDGSWHLLEDEFREKVVELEQFFLQSVTPKRAFDQTSFITGTELATLVNAYVEAINTPGMLPSLESSWTAVCKLRLDDSLSQQLQEYTRKMEERTAGILPMEEDASCDQEGAPSLMQLHWSVFDECYHKLKGETEAQQKHGLSEYCSAVLHEFTQQVAKFGDGETDDLLSTGTLRGGILLKFVQENYQKSAQECEELWERLFKESGVYSQAIRALNQSKAVDLSSEMAQMEQEYMAQAVGPAKLKVLHHKREVNDVKRMLRILPGPPENVRLAGRFNDKRKIVWDPPSINPDSATKYIVQQKTKSGWEDIASTDKCWVMLDKQSSKKRDYRVVSWNEEEQNMKGEMEEPLVVSPESRWTSPEVKEELSYV